MRCKHVRRRGMPARCRLPGALAALQGSLYRARADTASEEGLEVPRRTLYLAPRRRASAMEAAMRRRLPSKSMAHWSKLHVASTATRCWATMLLNGLGLGLCSGRRDGVWRALGVVGLLSVLYTIRSYMHVHPIGAIELNLAGSRRSMHGRTLRPAGAPAILHLL